MNMDIFLIYTIKFNLVLQIYFIKINKNDIIVNMKNTSIGTSIKEYDVNSNKTPKITVQVKSNLVLLNDSMTLENTKTSKGRREYRYINKPKSENTKAK